MKSIPKTHHPNASHTIMYDDVRQRTATSKRPIPNASHTIRDGNFFQRATTQKRTIPIRVTPLGMTKLVKEEQR